MHVWPTFVQLNVCREFCTIFWTYLLKICKNPIQIDGLDSCLGVEGADARFGTHFGAHSKQDTRYNASLIFFLSKGTRRLRFISFSVLFYRVTKSFNTYFKNSY